MSRFICDKCGYKAANRFRLSRHKRKCNYANIESYDDFTIRELREIAKEKQVEGVYTKNKEQLVKVLGDK